MGKFYGTVKGQRGERTAIGSENSGFKSSCQSYDGSVIVKMWYDNKKLMVNIGLAKGSSSLSESNMPQFTGTFEELKSLLLVNKERSK